MAALERRAPMRVLITGGSGFIGTNLMERLRGKGATLLNADIAPPRNIQHAALWQRVDLCDRGAVMHCVREFRPDLVYHLGARTDLDGAAIADYAANTSGVSNLIDAVLDTPSIERVIFASSRLVCRIGYQPTHDDDYCPTTAYGESKVEGERIVRRRCSGAPFSWAILRPTSIWGPWFDVPYKLFFLAVAKGRYVHPRGVQIAKSFGFVGNTAHQLAVLGRTPDARLTGSTMYLADYPPIEVSQMAGEIQRASHAQPVRSVPLLLLRAMASAGDAAKALGMRNPPLTTFRLSNLLSPMVHDLAPLETLCGPLPFCMTDGVRQTVHWLKAQGEIH